MMTCEACQRLIADHDAGDALPTSVADHIAHCSTCAAVFVEERHVRLALHNAPWPTPAHAGDLRKMMAYAASHEAERRLRRHRAARRWAGGLGLLAVVVSLIAQQMQRTGTGAGHGLLPSALPLGLGVLAWVWLEVIGRRLAVAGATTGVQLGIGLGRAAIGLAVVVALLEPGRLTDLPYAVARMAGGPAEAQGGVFEAELLCAAAGDGRLRLVRASEGCRGHEVAVARDGRVTASGSTANTDVPSIRFGTATLPAGASAVTVKFAPPMADGSYKVMFTPHSPDKPTTIDEACHVLGIGGKYTGHFTFDIRRCWYEGIDVPHDWAASDITVDWVVIGGR